MKIGMVNIFSLLPGALPVNGEVDPLSAIGKRLVFLLLFLGDHEVSASERHLSSISCFKEVVPKSIVKRI